MSEQYLLGQLYRGQLAHADTWRQRLDTTTNWAVMLTAALLTWIFSSPSNPQQPATKIPFGEALVRRLRRVHGAILSLLLLAWIFKVAVFPEQGTAMVDAMSIADIPGAAVAAAVGLYAIATLTLSLWPRERHANGEIEHSNEFNYKHD